MSDSSDDNKCIRIIIWAVMLASVASFFIYSLIYLHNTSSDDALLVVAMLFPLVRLIRVLREKNNSESEEKRQSFWEVRSAN